MKKWSEVRRVRDPGEAAATAQALSDALTLYELRKERGLTQVQLAERMKIRQASVSEIERHRKLYLDTLRTYVEALGGTLEVAAVFDGERIPLALEGRELDAVGGR